MAIEAGLAEEFGDGELPAEARRAARVRRMEESERERAAAAPPPAAAPTPVAPSGAALEARRLQIKERLAEIEQQLEG